MGVVLRRVMLDCRALEEIILLIFLIFLGVEPVLCDIVIECGVFFLCLRSGDCLFS